MIRLRVPSGPQAKIQEVKIHLKIHCFHSKKRIRHSKNLLRPTRALARVPTGWVGGALACGLVAVRVGTVRVRAVRVGAKILRIVLSRSSFCFLFQFLTSFVELRWSLRVFIIENVLTRLIWALQMCVVKTFSMMKRAETTAIQQKTPGTEKKGGRGKKREILDRRGRKSRCPGQTCTGQGWVQCTGVQGMKIN